MPRNGKRMREVSLHEGFRSCSAGVGGVVYQLVLVVSSSRLFL